MPLDLRLSPPAVLRAARTELSAFVATLSLVLAAVVATGAPATADAVADLVTTIQDEGTTRTVLAGEQATVTVTVENTGVSDRFNLGYAVLVPEGLTPVSASTGQGVALGAPRVLPAGALGEGVPAPGTELWVLEDVSDLPTGAASLLVVTFTPDPVRYPVGSSVTVEVTPYASEDPRYRPVFPGSTGVGGPEAGSATVSGAPVEVTVHVSAIAVSKTQLTYEEDELLRGSSEQGAVYAITVRNTTQGTTGEGGGFSGVELVDWLPAGLEFLGCADDNSTHDWSGEGSGEYAGAPGPLGGAVSVAGCLTPTEVDTVVATDADAETYGVVAGKVYTRVTWALPTLAAGESRTIRYGALVPLRENTLDWSLAPDGEAPYPASGAQAANLDNNTGPLTRQGGASEARDGMGLTNHVRAAGWYDGPVADGTDRLAVDTTSHTVTAMDLAVVKTASRHDFEHNGWVSFTLTVRTSEYVEAHDVVVRDTLPDGMCLVTSSSSSACADTGTSFAIGDWQATVVSRNPDGTTELAFTYLGGTVAPSAELSVTYVAAMGASYVRPSLGPTTGGDSFRNEVVVEGRTTLRAGVDAQPGEGGERLVRDDSDETLTAPVAEISKKVLARDAVPAGGDCTAVAPDAPEWQTGTAEGFVLGDLACFLLTVDFPEAVDTRNAVVGDVLPAGR